MTTAKVKLTKDLVEAIIRNGKISDVEVYVPLPQIEFNDEAVGFIANEFDEFGHTTTVVKFPGTDREVEGLEDETPIYLHPKGLPEEVLELLVELAENENELNLYGFNHGAQDLLEQYGVEVEH